MAITSNKSTFAICKALAFVATIFVFGCDNYCPPSPPPPPCLSPNPLISKQATGFSVMPGTFIQGAASVVISTKDVNNNLLDTDTIAPSATRFYAYPHTAVRPIQLHFVYKTASGDTLAEDMLRVDDSEINNGGIVAIDVLMGRTTTNPPGNPATCPSTSGQPIATGTGSVNFAWAPNDWFKVIVVHNSVTKVFGLHAKASQIQGAAGLVLIYDSNVFNCLGNPAITFSDDEKTGYVETSSTNLTCKVSGTDNNDGQTPRRIVIEGPSGCNITVMK